MHKSQQGAADLQDIILLPKRSSDGGANSSRQQKDFLSVKAASHQSNQNEIPDKDDGQSNYSKNVFDLRSFGQVYDYAANQDIYRNILIVDLDYFTVVAIEAMLFSQFGQEADCLNRIDEAFEHLVARLRKN